MLPVGVNPDLSSKLNEPEPINIKGISTCYQCKSNNILYDEQHDEIYCHSCGTVLRQAFNDYEMLIKDINHDEEPVVYDKLYFKDLVKYCSYVKSDWRS